MANKIENLNFAGSFIRQLTLMPGKELRIQLLHGPLKKGQGQIVEEVDLVFHGLQNCLFDLNADPWLEIISLETDSQLNTAQDDTASSQNSPKTTATNSGSNSTRTFELRCKEGRLLVNAQQLRSTIMDEITLVDRSSSLTVPSDSLSPPDESIDILCAFCGRKGAEVSKIITGSEANICGDCVMTCVDLIKPKPPAMPTED
jgi:hypothetical protein